MTSPPSTTPHFNANDTGLKDGMEAADWNKLMWNYDELMEVHPDSIIVHLYQNGVITLSEKQGIDKIKVHDKQMEHILDIIKIKPGSLKAFHHFIEALKDDPAYIHLVGTIIGTDTKSETSLKAKTDPHVLNSAVRNILLQNYVDVQGQLTPIDEVRDLLKSEQVFTGQNEWNNESLVKFITKVYIAVEIEKVKEQSGRKTITVTRRLPPGTLDSTFGTRRILSLLVAELTSQTKDFYPAFLRKFDNEVTQTDKYTKGHCADVSVNIRAKKTQPVRNFYLVDDKDQKKAFEVITTEVIPFISACLNDRRNGTIYFGISPTKTSVFKEGEIVGLCLLKDKAQAEIKDAIKGSFTQLQIDAINCTVRDAKFVPVIGTESNFVIEVDVVPVTTVLENDIIRTKERYLPDRFLKFHKGKENIVFRFSDEGFPKVVSSEELCQFEKIQPRLVEQRKQEESQVNPGTGPNLRLKLLKLLTGGSEQLQDTIFPFLLTSPIDDYMKEDYWTDKIAFIKHLHPQVVFDFDEKGASEGLLKNIEDKQESTRILTTNDFDESQTKKEAFNELQKNLEEEVRIAWMFCNGHSDLSIPTNSPLEWNKEKSCAFQKALKCFTDIFEKERIIIIICLFSTNYTTMIEACDEILRKLPDNWIVLAETENIAKLWQDQILLRNKATKSDINEKCVIGLPWEQVNTIICHASDKEISHDFEIPSSTGAFIDVREKKLKDWCDIQILSCNDFTLSIPKDDKENVRKQVEEKFYRGDLVEWLNFAFKDQVLKRDVHSQLIEVVKQSLEGKEKNDEEMVNVVSVLHQPGAGGTTSAKHVLWDLRREYRCCVVNRISSQTCSQLDELRRYKDNSPKPLLILVDNEEKFDYLRDGLEEKGKERMQYGEECFHIYCVIIVCRRRAILPMQLKMDQVALRQELTTSELEWFKEKQHVLASRYEKNKDENVNPEFLIAFNILRQNFNKAYVSNVVKAFTEAVKSVQEIKLLKFVSLLNTFDSDFRDIPVSCFDPIFSEESKEKYKNGSRALNWEAKLSQGIKVLLNLSSNKRITNKGSQHLKVFSKIIAHDIFNRMKEKTGQKDSEIMLELLAFGIFQHTTADHKVLQTIVNNVFKKREMKKNGIDKQQFSEFIIQLESKETTESVTKILEELYLCNQDPFTAQLLARYYIKIRLWEKAEKIAKQGTEKLRDNSFLWDTYGQVFKSQLYAKIFIDKSCHDGTRFNEREIHEMISLAKKCLMAFRKGQSVCELEPSTYEENNLAAYFGELRAIALLLSALKMSPHFKDQNALHKFLVDRPYQTPKLRFLKEDEIEFLKSLENCSKEAMRRLDDEFLQMKGKVTRPTDQQEKDRKTLIDLKASLDVFFGEFKNNPPHGFTERDMCDYRMRRARHLGASSLNSLLDMRKEGKKDTLNEIMQLLYQNMISSQRQFYDLRSMLDIVTICLLDKDILSEINYQLILLWCKEMYLCGKPLQGNRHYLEMYLYFVLYNFPTEERLRYDIINGTDLSSSIHEWRIAFKRNYPKSTRFGKSRETTLFFLGNGQPLQDIIFFDKTEVIKMYKIHEQLSRPRFSNNLRVLSGILAEGGNEVILQVKTVEKSSLKLTVPTAYHIKKDDMFKKRVYFYIGFSFSGPKAFGMCIDKPKTCAPTLYTADKQVQQIQKIQPEKLLHLMEQHSTIATQLDSKQINRIKHFYKRREEKERRWKKTQLLSTNSKMNRHREREASKEIAALKRPVKKMINLLLLGKAGIGKSSTGNTMLKRNEFFTSDNQGCAPPACQLECYKCDDVLLRVVDTPGLMGIRNTPHEVLEIMFNAMNLCSEGFNAFIYVLAYGDRFTQEDKDVLSLLKECFGDKFAKDFFVVVFTKGDSFDIHMEEQGNSNSFKDWLKNQAEPPEFKELIDECQKRVVLFYNVGVRYQTERENSRNKLMKIVRSLPSMYTRENFANSSRSRIKLVSHLKSHYEIQDLLSLMKQYLQKSISVTEEMAVTFSNEEVKIKNLEINEYILKSKETLETLAALKCKEGKKMASVDTLTADLYAILANTKITTKPCEEKLKEMMASLLEKVDRLKNDPSFNTVYIGHNLHKKSDSALRDVIGGAITGGLGVAALAIMGGGTNTATIRVPLVVASVVGAAFGGASAYISKTGNLFSVFFFFLFFIIFTVFRL
ncbi:hypothetical protein Btru_031180 [Bulinus truncatus]|nr:hypothetical protein Btru_031180 [Bulinus truncatus]